MARLQSTGIFMRIVTLNLNGIQVAGLHGCLTTPPFPKRNIQDTSQHPEFQFSEFQLLRSPAATVHTPNLVRRIYTLHAEWFALTQPCHSLALPI